MVLQYREVQPKGLAWRMECPLWLPAQASPGCSDRSFPARVLSRRPMVLELGSGAVQYPLQPEISLPADSLPLPGTQPRTR